MSYTPPPAYQPVPPITQAAPAWQPPVPRQNQLSIVAFVLAFVAPLGGVIAGHIALSQIKRTGDDGRGLALAGVIVGYVILGFIVAYILFIIVLFATLGAGAWGEYPGYY